MTSKWKERLSIRYKKFLEILSKIARADILKMTTIASSGHPGGSMSSIDLYISSIFFSNIFEKSYEFISQEFEIDELFQLARKFLNYRIENNSEELYLEFYKKFSDVFKLRDYEKRDRFIISHGHTSPGWYSAVSSFGLIRKDFMNAGFRKYDSPFAGHVEHIIPLVDWDTGNLGQGLSAAAGKALYMKQKGYHSKVFVFMGDGEQQKGQISEARRFIIKNKLTNIIVFIDYNELQISGNIHEVMPQNLKEEWEASGFIVKEIDGHNFDDIYNALKIASIEHEKHFCFIAKTTMGKSISFMENKEKYHGSTLKEEECISALQELNVINDLEYLKKLRKTFDFRKLTEEYEKSIPQKDFYKNLNKIISAKSLEYYDVNTKTDCRSAYGKALIEVTEAVDFKKYPIFVFDCDLAGSVKTKEFAKKHKDYFIQTGIQEHHAAVASGALSKENALVFFSDFAVFGIAETYNQQRLNAINDTDLKVVLTHAGTNVGEDGKTHQCINYIGLASTIFDFKLILPADPNQTLHVIKYVSRHKGNYFVVMGRSKTPIITIDNVTPFYGRDYEFEYGNFDEIYKSDEIYIISAGPVFGEVYNAVKDINTEKIKVGLINIHSPLSIKADLKDILEDKIILVYEDHNINSGLYKILLSYIAENKVEVKDIKGYGISEFAPSGNYKDIYKLYGLDSESIKDNVKKFLK